MGYNSDEHNWPIDFIQFNPDFFLTLISQMPLSEFIQSYLSNAVGMIDIDHVMSLRRFKQLLWNQNPLIFPFAFDFAVQFYFCLSFFVFSILFFLDQFLKSNAQLSLFSCFWLLISSISSKISKYFYNVKYRKIITAWILIVSFFKLIIKSDLIVKFRKLNYFPKVVVIESLNDLRNTKMKLLALKPLFANKNDQIKNNFLTNFWNYKDLISRLEFTESSNINDQIISKILRNNFALLAPKQVLEAWVSEEFWWMRYQFHISKFGGGQQPYFITAKENSLKLSTLNKV